MEAIWRDAGERVEPHRSAPRLVAPRERAALWDWLDDGLRAGRRGRLAAEYPLSVGSGGTCGHHAVYVGDAPVAHAMLHRAVSVAKGRRVPLGLVGNVYTDPGHRGQGLAQACVEACLREALGAGLPLVALWSDLHAYYARIGFRPTGRETFYSLSAEGLARLGADRDEKFCVRPAVEADFPVLERHYAAKPVHAERLPGALEACAAAPDTELWVAEAGSGPAGYAALGRGDDFSGVVHEWAGEASAVAACLSRFVSERGPLGLLAGPEPERLVDALERAGIPRRTGCFALVRLLDAGRLWTAIRPRGSRIAVHQDGDAVHIEAPGLSAEIGTEAALSLFFSGELEPELLRSLPRPVRRALARVLPWPLYLWGFDSV